MEGDRVAERWRRREWHKMITAERNTDHGVNKKTQFIGIDSGLEWAEKSKHICGIRLEFDLPQNRWRCELGADPCGDLRSPVSQSDYYCNVAVAKACMKAVREILKHADPASPDAERRRDE